MTKTQDRKNDNQENEKDVLFKEVVTIRPTTTTRPALTITVYQRQTDNQEIALATAVFSKPLDLYHEKPELMKDTANKMIYAALLMEKLNKKVKNGK